MNATGQSDENRPLQTGSDADLAQRLIEINGSVSIRYADVARCDGHPIQTRLGLNDVVRLDDRRIGSVLRIIDALRGDATVSPG